MAACPADSLPDHDHVFPRADPRLEVGRRVVHAGPFEGFKIVDRQAAIAGTGGDDDRTARDLAAVGQRHDMKPVLGAKPGGDARGVESGPEALGLDRGPRHEVLTRDPVRETGIVLGAGWRGLGRRWRRRRA